jgi:hypothetical protein
MGFFGRCIYVLTSCCGAHLSFFGCTLREERAILKLMSVFATLKLALIHCEYNQLWPHLSTFAVNKS